MSVALYTSLIWQLPRFYQRKWLPLVNEDARIYYQGMGGIFQGPETGISSMLLQLAALFPCINQLL